MSYESLRSAVRNAVELLIRDYPEGALVLEEHPHEAKDMMTLMVRHNDTVIGSYIFTTHYRNRAVQVHRIDPETLARRFAMKVFIIGEKGLSEERIGWFRDHLRRNIRVNCSSLDSLLGAHQKRAKELSKVAVSMRPWAKPYIGVDKDGKFHLHLHDLSDIEVMQIMSAVPSAPTTSPTTCSTTLERLLEEDF